MFDYFDLTLRANEPVRPVGVIAWAAAVHRDDDMRLKGILA